MRLVQNVCGLKDHSYHFTKKCGISHGSEKIDIYIDTKNFCHATFNFQKKTPLKDLNCLNMPRNWPTDMHMKMRLEE